MLPSDGPEWLSEAGAPLGLEDFALLCFMPLLALLAGVEAAPAPGVIPAPD